MSAFAGLGNVEEHAPWDSYKAFDAWARASIREGDNIRWSLPDEQPEDVDSDEWAVWQIEYQDTEERLLAYWDRMDAILTEPDQPVDVWRVLALPEDLHIDFANLGRYWSDVESCAEAHWGKGPKRARIHGSVLPHHIDWEGGVATYLMFGDIECEIRLLPNASIDILDVKTNRSKHRVVYDPPLAANTGESPRELRSLPENERERVFGLGSAFTHGDFWGSAGAGLLIRAKSTGRYLLMHRSEDVNEPGTWGILGGAIDKGEDPREAARREAHEEAGLTDAIYVEPEPFYTFKSGSFRYFNFLAEVAEEFKPKYNWESQGHRWVTLDKLPKNLHPGVEAFLPALCWSAR